MDIAILLAIQSFREATNGVFSTFFSKMTLFGESYLSFLLLLCMYWCVDREFGRRAMMGLGLSRFMNGIIKLTACVYRPWIRSAEIIPADGAKTTATGYSFPSGHSTTATFSLGHVGWNYRKESRMLAWVLYGMVALVLLSRLFLGVHTPQDVLVGCGSTILMVALGNVTVRWMDAGKNRDFVVLAGAVVLVVLGVVYVTFKPYPMDYDEAGKLIVDPIAMQPDTYSGFGYLVGVMLGLIFESRLVRFTVDAPLVDKLTRFAVGGLLYVFLHSAGRPIIRLVITDKNIAYMVSAMVTMFLVVGVYPMLFSAWERKKRN